MYNISMIIFEAYVLFFGLIIGSFLNALIYRMEVGKALSGRSFCPHCKKKLAWYDLFPLFSWIFLGGRCRKCKKPISIQYPLVELATALIFLFVGRHFLTDFALINFVTLGFWIFFSASLVAIFVYDLKHQIIPDQIVYPCLGVSLVYVLVISFLARDYSILTNHLLAGLIAGGLFYAIAVVTKGKGMGGGDIKLAAVMGFMLGGSILVALYSAFILGSLVGVGFVLAGKKKYGSKIAFGPFLVVGTFIALLAGEQILSFYDRMFL